MERILYNSLTTVAKEYSNHHITPGLLLLLTRLTLETVRTHIQVYYPYQQSEQTHLLNAEKVIEVYR